MTRRIIGLLVTLALGFLMASPAVAAQPGGKIARIGVLAPGAAAPGAAPTPSRCLQGFWQGLEELGYREGHNLHLEYRYAEDPLDRLPALATDLVRWQPDLIFTMSNPLAAAAKQATSSIPIVVGVANDFVESGLITNLAHPGGNLTGLEFRDIEFLGKRLELLKAALPAVARVAVLVQTDSPVYDRIPGEYAAETRALGVHVQRVEVGAPEAFERAFTEMAATRAEALIIMDDAVFAQHRHRLLELARARGLPTMSGGRHFAEAGSLLAFGAYVGDMCRRAVVYVDKILQGAKPGDLPVERATQPRLIVNLKTAQALGLTIPPTLLFQADEVLR
jgi:putative tryptophan/tyrosine transport system substrate-binding protein